MTRPFGVVVGAMALAVAAIGGCTASPERSTPSSTATQSLTDQPSTTPPSSPSATSVPSPTVPSASGPSTKSASRKCDAAAIAEVVNRREVTVEVCLDDFAFAYSASPGDTGVSVRRVGSAWEDYDRQPSTRCRPEA